MDEFLYWTNQNRGFRFPGNWPLTRTVTFRESRKISQSETGIWFPVIKSANRNREFPGNRDFREVVPWFRDYRRRFAGGPRNPRRKVPISGSPRSCSFSLAWGRMRLSEHTFWSSGWTLNSDFWNVFTKPVWPSEGPMPVYMHMWMFCALFACLFCRKSADKDTKRYMSCEGRGQKSPYKYIL